MQHSIISPSSAGIWGKPGGCTGYVSMVQMYPQIESESSMQGVAAHELCERMMQNEFNNCDFDLKVSTNGIFFDDEMLEAANLYMDDLCSIMLAEHKIVTEHRVDCKRINDISFGTVDAFSLDTYENILYIWDFKYGHGFVDVYENWQLINYAAGLIDELELTHDTKINFRIVQPRSYHSDGPIRNWWITVEKLKPYFDQLRKAAIESLGTNAKLKTGSHCKHCPARHACSPALQAGTDLFEVSSQPIPTELSEQAIGLQMSMIKRATEQLKCLESGLSEQIKFMISKGINVPGWVLEHGTGRKEWTLEPQQIIDLGNSQGIDLCKKQEVITPTQAIKLGLSEDIANKYAKRKNTGVKLVQQDANLGFKIFKKMEQ